MCVCAVKSQWRTRGEEYKPSMFNKWKETKVNYYFVGTQFAKYNISYRLEKKKTIIRIARRT